MDINNKLKVLRKDKGLTLKELSKLTNLSISYISDIEHDRKKPSIEAAKKLAEGLNISLSELLEEDTKTTYKLSEKDFINIPIIGTIRAGEPILANENIEGFLQTPKSGLCYNKEYFYLRVTGDSMNLEFTEGTLLLIEKCNWVENGSIAVILIDGLEATVKKIIHNENIITLIPMSNNPNYVPKIYDVIKDKIKIIGKVKQATKVY